MTPTFNSPHDPFSAKTRRVWALLKKETRQIIRDPSSIAVGVGLPIVLILLFGYGLSLDVKDIPVAVVLEDTSPDAAELASAFQLSPYFHTQLVTSMARAQELILSHRVNGIVRIRPDFSRRVRNGEGDVQIVLHGGDANRARIVQGYAQAALGQWTKRQIAEGRKVMSGPVIVQNRLWFNEEDQSRYFLVPGLIVLVITLNGALLTTLVVAREWERGTFEALFVTPAQVSEILLSKVLPYFGLGIFGLMLCLLAAKILFGVPFRGSLWVLGGGSLLYLLVALGLGLLISTTAKAQFVAGQITLTVAFVPTLMLSGFIYDVDRLPLAMRVITHFFPARYYVALLQTVLLAGDIWSVILPNAAVLACASALLFALTRAATRKRLD
jgi:ABC-2 type transport system permease protein